ncbi:MAG: transporter substrate-binding domain-containing protein [Tissierellia bacterium]|nr:transporter substrate-binding domain-containing protein [Tissierellia bacterium]MDD4779849.1 transporter substrate-binding domain-containing protein [Tissierellia bacterium]
MKKLLSLMLAIILAFTLTACSNDEAKNENPNEAEGAKEFRVGLECNYAPFNWTQSEETEDSVPIPSGGYADGYDVQIAKKIAEGLGRELVIVKTEWDGLTPAVNSGKIDAIIAGMSPTAERALTIDFTDPYYESDLVVVVKKDGAYANAKSLEDFANSKITGQLNTFHYSVIDQIPNVKKQNALENFPAMIVALESGKIDGYVSERPGAVSAVASNPDLTFVSFEEGNGFEASPEDVAIAVGLKKDSEFKEQINEILKGISEEERQTLMDEAVANQPLQQ